MPPLRTAILGALLLGAAPLRAQTPDSVAVPPADAVVRPSTARGLVVRATGGLTNLSLSDAAAFHQAVADTYVAAGVPVPTQRSFAPGAALGLDVLWANGSGRQYGGGLRYAESSAYSLYGDYAGTLDLVTQVSAVFAESVSFVELRPAGPLRPFLGSRGGTVFATSSTREDIDLGEIGASRSTFSGRGVGYSIEGFGGVTASAGPVGLFVQGGYRFARVRRLTGSSVTNGQIVEEGQLPYSLELSGWTGLVGLTVRRP